MRLLCTRFDDYAVVRVATVTQTESVAVATVAVQTDPLTVAGATVEVTTVQEVDSGLDLTVSAPLDSTWNSYYGLISATGVDEDACSDDAALDVLPSTAVNNTNREVLTAVRLCTTSELQQRLTAKPVDRNRLQKLLDEMKFESWSLPKGCKRKMKGLIKRVARMVTGNGQGKGRGNVSAASPVPPSTRVLRPRPSPTVIACEADICVAALNVCVSRQVAAVVAQMDDTRAAEGDDDVAPVFSCCPCK